MSKGIEITVRDLETGEVETKVIENDYALVTAGTCHLAHTQLYPKSGTHVLTLKGVKR